MLVELGKSRLGFGTAGCSQFSLHRDKVLYLDCFNLFLAGRKNYKTSYSSKKIFFHINVS